MFQELFLKTPPSKSQSHHYSTSAPHKHQHLLSHLFPCRQTHWGSCIIQKPHVGPWGGVMHTCVHRDTIRMQRHTNPASCIKSHRTSVNTLSVTHYVLHSYREGWLTITFGVWEIRTDYLWCLFLILNRLSGSRRGGKNKLYRAVRKGRMDCDTSRK